MGPFFGVLLAGSMAASPRGPPPRERASGRRAPPAGRRCRGSRTRRRRIRICPDSVDGLCAAFGRLSSSGRSAPSSSAGPRRPSAERVPALSQIASMRPDGSGAASSRAGRARASAPASRCPCAAGARFPPGRLNGPASPGERERGAGPRRRPWMRHAFCPISPFRPMGPEAKKEGPAVSGGPLGDPWWSLGGSNP